MACVDSFYAVRKGRHVQHCIFLRWNDCEAELKECGDADYAVFAQWQQAVDYLRVGSSSLRAGRGAAACEGAVNVTTTTTAAAAPKPKQKTQKKNSNPVTTKNSPNGSKENHNATTNSNKKHPKTPLHETLLEGYQQCRSKGWRCQDLGLSFREPHKSNTQSKYLQDLAELRGFLAASSSSTAVNLSKSQKRSILDQSDHSVLHPVSIRYLNHAWGVHRKYHNDLQDKLQANPAATETNTAFASCTIECRQAARMRYTPKKLFLNHRVHELTQKSLPQHQKATKEQQRLFQKAAAQEWDTTTQQQWKQAAVQHDLEWPTIEPTLVSKLRHDPRRPTALLVQDIGGWCGRTTVAKWRQRWESSKSNHNKRRTKRKRVVEEEDAAPIHNNNSV